LKYENIFLHISFGFLMFELSKPSSNKSNPQHTQQSTMKQSIYSFKVTDLEGKEFDFASLKGKK
jgi:glutathione peroxidase